MKFGAKSTLYTDEVKCHKIKKAVIDLTSDQDKVFVTDIREGQSVDSPFLLEEIKLGQTKNGRPYVSLKLKDKTGRIEARVWDQAESFYANFKDGDIAQVTGSGESYQGQVQLKVIKAGQPEKPDNLDQGLFQPASPFDPEEMYAKLLKFIDIIGDPYLKRLLQDIFSDPDIAAKFKKAPAAKRFHHAYLSGLLEHTLSVVRAASFTAGHYPGLNQDLLLAGAMIHDLGKIDEFELDKNGDYTTGGRLLGHMILGLDIVQAKIAEQPDFPADLARLLKHLIISHHGEYEFGSPKKPKIIEALALYCLDEMDAKINGIGGFIERHAVEDTGWTDYNRLMERFFYQPDLEELLEAPDISGDEGEESSNARRRPERDPNQMSFLEDD